MFIGHFGVGFAAKAVAPRTSLGTLFLAAQFIDLLWPTFLLFGAESVRIDAHATAVTPLDFVHYPFSHSLLAVLGWALLVGGGYYAIRRYARGAAVLAALVVSHWALDAIVHRPDLPLYPGSASRVGLGMWSSLAGTLLLELTIFAVGVGLYLKSTRSTKHRDFVLGSLVAVLLLIYIGNLFGSPPPDAMAIAWAGQAQWLLVLWGYWADRRRVPASGEFLQPGLSGHG
jgi:membrane-bound metal-dependent hydrolase YbcI (DUF457 family)